MKGGKFHAPEILKSQQIKSKASILTSSSKGGHVLQRRTRPPKADTSLTLSTMLLVWQKGERA